MPLIDNTSPPNFAIEGVAFTSLAAPSRGSQENAMWRVTVAPRTQGVVHHMTREELILATGGEGVVQIGADRYMLSPGDVFAVPAFTNFRLESRSDAPFEAIAVLPAGGHAVIPGQPSFQPPWSI